MEQIYFIDELRPYRDGRHYEITSNIIKHIKRYGNNIYIHKNKALPDIHGQI